MKRDEVDRSKVSPMMLHYMEIKDKYPIVLTRNMNTARKWLRDRALGTERTGILVTKEAARFKPLAVHILPSGDENAVHT